MNLKLSNAISVFVCLLAAAFAQTSGAGQEPQVVYTTPPKMIAARLKPAEPETLEVRIKVTYTLTSANYDDTMVGTLVFWIPEEARKKIAEAASLPLSSIPASLMRKDVAAGFLKETSCPMVGIDIGETELDVVGATLSFKRIVVDVIETPQEVPQHFCFWTRQINTNRPRRGVISSLNRLIIVEP